MLSWLGITVIDLLAFLSIIRLCAFLSINWDVSRLFQNNSRIKQSPQVCKGTIIHFIHCALNMRHTLWTWQHWNWWGHLDSCVTWLTMIHCDLYDSQWLSDDHRNKHIIIVDTRSCQKILYLDHGLMPHSNGTYHLLHYWNALNQSIKLTMLDAHKLEKHNPKWKFANRTLDVISDRRPSHLSTLIM